MPDKEKSNYFDNNTNTKNEYMPVEEKVIIEVDHGDHTHRLDITNLDVHDLNDSEKTNEMLGKAHGDSDHYQKDENKDDK